MKKYKLTPEIERYVQQVVREEINRDVGLEHLQSLVAQWFNEYPETYKGNNALQLWSRISNTELGDRLGKKFANLFYNNLMTGKYL